MFPTAGGASLIGPSLGFLSRPCSIYVGGAALVVPGANAQVIGDGATQRFRSTAAVFQAQCSVNYNLGAAAAYAGGWWVEWVYDGATLSIRDSLGNAGGGVEALQAAAACGLFATNTSSQMSRYEHYWTLTYGRALTPTERLIPRAAMAAYLGL